MKYLYELTDYKNIYRNTSWGNCFPTCDDKNILENRNSFIKDYNIKNSPKRILNKVKTYISNLQYTKARSFLDHLEFYTTKNGDSIIITSPYNVHDDDTDFQEIYKAKKIYNLYNNNSRSYIIFI